MSNLARHFAVVHFSALAVVAALFAGFYFLGGGDEAVESALFAGLMLALLSAIIALVSSQDLARAATRHWISALGALIFLLWHLATALPLAAELQKEFAHPYASDFDWRAPSISIAPQATLEGVVAMLGPIAAFALGALVAPDRARRDRTGRWVAALTILLSLLALYDHFIGQTGQAGRLSARQPSPNAAAALFGALAIFAAALVVRAGKGKLGALPSLPRSWLWASGLIGAPLSTVALIFALTCALLTESRAGLLALAVGFLTFSALIAMRRSRERASGFWLAPIAGALAISAWVLMQGAGPVIDRLADSQVAAQSRWELIEPHWNAFLERPVLGHGLNTYHEINSMAATPDNVESLRFAGAVHNIYVTALEETGLVGLAIMMVMLAPPLLRGGANALTGVAGVEWSAAVCGAATLFLLHGLVDFDLQIPTIAALFAFCLGAFVECGATGR